MQKILALAERGAQGERETAQAHLEKLLMHHGLSMEDLLCGDAGCAELSKFEVAGRMETRLLRQVVAMVTGTLDIRQFRRGRSQRHVAFMLTSAQYAQAKLAFAVTRQALEREMELTFKAFVQVNGLYAYEAPPEEAEPLTPERVETMKELLARMNTIEKVPLHKAITSG
ncbi:MULTISPECIES: hypothetical protein [unclassified Rhodanobacter]|uniref:hypothetical protein n=1 Tax=unclassified Rhodanobacter TaxID=2621553 RepID=UPI0012901912|nr:hypothetical protein [Rhodanobacter sp. FW510-R10]